MTTKNKKYSRNTVNSKASIRKESDGKTYIDFYPAVFNQKSKLIREWGEVFYEIIDRHAFDNVLKDTGLNTIHTVDHVRMKMLGRVVSGTLQLTTDEYGLKATLEMPDTTLGRDMVVMIERGDYFECSFIFTIAEKGVHYDRSEEIPTRTVTDIDNLIDTAFVIDGAYANTNIKKRFQSEYEEPEFNPQTTGRTQQTNAPHLDILKKRAEIHKLNS